MPQKMYEEPGSASSRDTSQTHFILPDTQQHVEYIGVQTTSTAQSIQTLEMSECWHLLCELAIVTCNSTHKELSNSFCYDIQLAQPIIT